jgi:cysteinyl-tRNA synthetase
LSKELNDIFFKNDLKEEIRIYVCGPTVYDHCHLGHGRIIITFDLLYRLLSYLYDLKIKFVQNITDIDDKIIERAKLEGRSIGEVSGEYGNHFLNICELFNIKSGVIRPRATEYINSMITYIDKLLKMEMAYITPFGVYLNTNKIDYGYFNQNENCISHVTDEKIT